MARGRFRSRPERIIGAHPSSEGDDERTSISPSPGPASSEADRTPPGPGAPLSARGARAVPARAPPPPPARTAARGTVSSAAVPTATLPRPRAPRPAPDPALTWPGTASAGVWPPRSRRARAASGLRRPPRSSRAERRGGTSRPGVATPGLGQSDRQEQFRAGRGAAGHRQRRSGRRGARGRRPTEVVRGSRRVGSKADRGAPAILRGAAAISRRWRRISRTNGEGPASLGLQTLGPVISPRTPSRRCPRSRSGTPRTPPARRRRSGRTSRGRRYPRGGSPCGR